MSFVSRIICVIFAYLYPSYYSFKALKSNDTKAMTKYFVFWITIALFNFVEFFGDILLSWFPLYYEVKTAFILFLVFPEGRGALYVYKNYIHPYFLQNEQRIDLALQKGQTDFVSLVFTSVQRFYLTAFNTIHESIQKGSITFPLPTAAVASPSTMSIEQSSSSNSLNFANNPIFQSIPPREENMPPVVESLYQQREEQTQPQQQQTQTQQQNTTLNNLSFEDDDWEMPSNNYDDLQVFLEDNPRQQQPVKTQNVETHVPNQSQMLQQSVSKEKLKDTTAQEPQQRIVPIPSDVNQIHKRQPKSKSRILPTDHSPMSASISVTSSPTATNAAINPLSRSVSEQPRSEKRQQTTEQKQQIKQVDKNGQQQQSPSTNATSSSSSSSWWFW